MSDTIPMSDPPPPGGDAGVSDSTRKCAHCGESYSGISHENCPGDRTVKDPRGPTTRAQIDAIPEEAAAAAADPDRALNQYVLVRQIGKGGMGTVWKAWDRTLTRWVAIKFLLASDEDGVARFRREAKLAARLRHPNIAAIYEVGTAPSKQRGTTVDHYLAMEYIDGQTLASAKLTLPETLEIFHRVAKAMDAAHRGGVIHRDLKPANIMITQDKWPYVMDFGLAKALETESSLSVSGAVMGTPAYMPPEQAEGRIDDIDAQSDLYSLGATLYSVLVGQAPFSAQNVMSLLRKVSQEQPPAPRSLKPDLPLEIEAVILKAMAKDKKDRHPNAAAFADDLTRCMTGTKVAELATSTRETERPSKTGMFVGAGLAAAALIAAAIYFGAEKPKPAPATPSRPPTSPESPVAAPDPLPVRRPVEFPKDVVETFHLRVTVYPFPEVVKVLRDGEPVKLGETTAPFLESNLPVGDYELTLRHPRLGERKVTIAKSTIKGGRTYVLWGRMDGPTLQVSESP